MTNFIQIHALQFVPPSCINRDDVGQPKTATVGGVQRHRVSSQSWKKAIRDDFASHLDTSEVGIRTKEIVALLAEEARKHTDSDNIDAATLAMVEGMGFGIEKNKKSEEGSPKFSSLFFISPLEVEHLGKIAADMADAGATRKGDFKGEFKKRATQHAVEVGIAFDVAMFGRMLAVGNEGKATKSALTVDASVAVSHAISTHAVMPEIDFYTAVDDYDDSGSSAMIGTQEMVSSVLYRYAWIDMDHLEANLGSRENADEAAKAFIRSFVSSMPTGKQNSFANRTLPEAVVIETGEAAPCNGEGAFVVPIEAGEGHDVMTESVNALIEHRSKQSNTFGSLAPAGKTHAIAVGDYQWADTTTVHDTFDEMISEVL